LLSGLAASLALVVVAGTAGVTWQWQRAEFQRRRAVDAMQHGSRTLAALLPLFDPGIDAKDRARREREVLPTALLDYYRSSIQHQLDTDPELRAPLSSMTMSVMLLLSRNAPRADALRTWQEARTTFEGLIRDDPTNPVVQECAARCLTSEGMLLVESGRLAEGEARLSQASARWQAYVALQEGDPAADLNCQAGRDAWTVCLIELGPVEFRLGRKAQALDCLRQARALAEVRLGGQSGSEHARRQLAHVCSRLAPLASDLQPREAISLWQRAIDLIEPIAVEKPADHDLQDALASNIYRLGGLEDRLDLVDDALADLRRAAAIYERLLQAKPDDIAHRCQLATSNHVIGRLLADSGCSKDAIEPYRSAIAHRERLVLDQPQKPRWHDDCAGTWYRLGEALKNLGHDAEADEAFEKSKDYKRQAHALKPGETKQHLAEIRR
jgi:tetratricopeptide (TPR) repeat protein